MTRTITQRALAAAGALILGVVGAVAISLPASAAVGPNIDPDTTGTLTLHKYEQPSPVGAPADGTEQTITGLTPIAGVEFTLTPVTGVNLTTNAGWTSAAGYNTALRAAQATDPGVDPATILAPGAALGTPLDFAPTDATGETSLSGIALGLYLVQEVASPSNVIAPALPFLITVPLPNSGGTGFNYDIHVYPKNSVADEPVKTLSTTDAYGIGDTVTWTITSVIPNFADRDELTSYVITDDLDPRLTYVPSAVVTVNGVALTAPDVTVSTTDPVTVTFNGTGLDALYAAPGEDVVIEIDTEVNAPGAIVNTASVAVNGTTFPSNDVTTEWVPVQLTKVETGSPTTVLAGAVFSVFLAETGGAPLSIDVAGVPTTQFTTAADGTLLIPGLKAGVEYWVEEITAPVGYFAIEDRIQLGTGPLAAVATGVAGELETFALTIENPKIPAWAMPLTGGNGAMMFGIGGGALVLLAVGAALIVARRKKAAVEA